MLLQNLAVKRIKLFRFAIHLHPHTAGGLINQVNCFIWQEAISNFGAAYRIGLTATPQRKDGLHDVFFSHIGPIVYWMEGHKRVPLIWRIGTDTRFSRRSYSLYNGEVNTSKLVTMVSKVETRTDQIVSFAIRALKMGRKVLILSERVAHTKEMNELLNRF